MEFNKAEDASRWIERTTVNSFNCKQIVDFALSHNYTDVYTVMDEYAHLAESCDCPEMSNDHKDEHRTHMENAKRYVKLPHRTCAARNAVDCVLARNHRQLKTVPNSKWLESRWLDMGEDITHITDCQVFGEAWFYYQCFGSKHFDKIMNFILSVLTATVSKNNPFNPKKRYAYLRGPPNCGKSTFAAAVCKLFEGVPINVNVKKKDLPIHLSSAIGKRFVLFDNVGGFVNSKGNLSGRGLTHLNDMREHLDGHFEVPLKRKDSEPVHQVFPPGMLIMDAYILPEYLLPDFLKKRVEVFNFPHSRKFQEHGYRVTMETIYIALVLSNLIHCEEKVILHCTRKKDEWIKNVHGTCPMCDVQWHFASPN